MDILKKYLSIMDTTPNTRIIKCRYDEYEKKVNWYMSRTDYIIEDFEDGMMGEYHYILFKKDNKFIKIVNVERLEEFL